MYKNSLKKCLYDIMDISLMNDLMKDMMIFDEMNEGHLPRNMICGFDVMLLVVMKCCSKNVMLMTVMKCYEMNEGDMMNMMKMMLMTLMKCFVKNVMLMTLMKCYKMVQGRKMENGEGVP